MTLHDILELRALAPSRPDCCWVEAECPASDYSASKVAMAVEDVDAHMLTLLTAPGEGSNMVVTVCADHSDPSAIARSLERYGYEVRDSYGSSNVDGSQAKERLAELYHLINM